MDYPDLILRTVLFYILILISLRVLGKREVGNLSVFDVVVFLLIAEVSASTIHSEDMTIWHGIIPVVVLAVVQMTVAMLSLKFKPVRDQLEGEPALMIRDGIIQETTMREHRYNLDDLFQQLREQQYGSVESIAYAFLESSGRLSVFEKNEHPLHVAVIMDGEIQHRHLDITGHSEQELRTELKKQGISSEEDVFYAAFNDDHLHVQLKVT